MAEVRFYPRPLTDWCGRQSINLSPFHLVPPFCMQFVNTQAFFSVFLKPNPYTLSASNMHKLLYNTYSQI